MRYSRYLRGNKGTETPTNLIFVDAEFTEVPNVSASDGKTFRLRLWCATRIRFDGGSVSRRSESQGRTAEEFHQWVDGNSETSRCTWLFSHNAYVDVTTLAFWRKLDDGYYTFAPKYKLNKDGTPSEQISWRGKLIAEDRPFFMQFRRGHKHFKWVDTCNYWPMTLEKVGESIGIDKLDLPCQTAPDDEWFARCKRDVEILEAAVVDLMRKWRAEDCGVFQVTGPQLAMNHFRHTCKVRTPDGEHLDLIPHPNSPQAKLEREAYFGGRVQPFYVGQLDHELYHVDVNSLYPAMMHKYSFPRRFVRFNTDISVSELRDTMRLYGAVAKVMISTRTYSYPLRINGRQYQVAGQFVSTLAGPELLHALDSGSAKSVVIAATYSMAPLFRDWVEYWYRRKVEAKQRVPPDLAEYEFCKLILASLSGKWAQRGRFWRDLPGRYALERWGGWIDDHPNSGRPCEWRGVAGMSQYLTKDEDSDHVFPAISAYIASHAREFMRAVINQLPRNSVYYMATDSLIINRAGYDALCKIRLVDDTKLGSFRLVASYGEGEIVGCNHYRLDNAVTVAGLHGRAKLSPTGKRLAEIWDRVATVIACGPTEEIGVRHVEPKDIRPDYKGIIGPDGFWRPHMLNLDGAIDSMDMESGYRLADNWPIVHSL